MKDSSKSSRAEEHSLVQRMLKGDERAMEAFGDTYFPPLYRYAVGRLSGNGELARDIVQTTVVKALRRLRSFRGEAPLISWLRACCRNEIAMYFRHAAIVPMLTENDDAAPVLEAVPNPPQVDQPERSLLRQESAQLVHETLDSLPPQYAQVLELKYLERLPVKEIASRLALGPKAAESMLTRARGAFRRRFEQKTHHRQAARPSDEGVVSA